MRLGTAVFATDRSWPIDDLAREVETRGLASLAVPEHTHMPVDHSPHPAGGDLPEEYQRTLDPFVALTVAAAVTTQLELMTGVCLLAQRDPVVTAKEVASLDHVSGGRLTFGVGYGWNVPEVEDHGVAFDERRAVVRERLEVMRSLWTREVTSADGPHVRLRASRAWPKPLQLPHPPVLLGAGLGPRTLADLVAVCDGWLPIGAKATAAGLPRLRAAWRDAGRDGEPLVHVYGTRPDAETLRGLAALGVDRVTVWLPSASRAESIPVLDRLARLVTELS
jgi:probable F420-dependent oxidoreductase